MEDMVKVEDAAKAADAANFWAFEKDYGKILAMVVVTAVREIEAQTGRKVLSLTVPKPANWEIPDKHTTISVKLGNHPGKRVCTYHGSKGNWFYDWFKKKKRDERSAMPEPAGG